MKWRVTSLSDLNILGGVKDLFRIEVIFTGSPLFDFTGNLQLLVQIGFQRFSHFFFVGVSFHDSRPEEIAAFFGAQGQIDGFATD